MVINAPYISGSAIITGDTVISGSLTVSGAIQATASWAVNSSTASFSLSGTTAATASYVQTAQTASYVQTAQTASFVTTAQTASFVTTAQTASYVLNAVSSSFAATASSADGFVVRQGLTGSNALFSGAITAQTLVVQTVTSSVVYSSGSNTFGNELSNVQAFTGSLRVTGSGDHYIVGGNVGIGTASPSYKLDVNGTGRFSSNIYIDGGTNVNTGNGIHMYYESNYAQLQLNGDSSAGGALIDFSTSGTDYKGRIIYRNSTNQFEFNTNGAGTPVLTLASTGAATFSSSVIVSSGTTSGYATLNLIDSGTGSARYGSIRKNYDSPFDLRIRASNSETEAPIIFDLSNDTEGMRIGSNGQFKLNFYTSSTSFTGTAAGYLAFDSSGNILTTTTPAGGITGTGTTNYIPKWTNSTELGNSSIYDNGNVGIGTPSPATQLHVSGSSAYLRVEKPGNDAIIESKANAGAYFLANSAADGFFGLELQQSGTGKWWLGSYSTSDFVIGRGARSSYFDYFHITTAGNVGIGTSSPATKLHVSGSDQQLVRITTSGALSSGFYDIVQILAANQTGGGLSLNIGKAESTKNLGKMVYVHSANGSDSNRLSFGFYDADNLLNLMAGGNVGIGTTSPSYRLHVSGSNSMLHGIIAGDDSTYGAPYKVVGFNSVNNGGNRILASTTTSDGMYFMAATGRGFNFRSNGGTTNNVTIDSSGNMGIGTETPNAALSLGTSVQDNKIYLYDGTSDKYGFGIRSNQFMIYSGNAGTSTGGITFGKFDGTTFTETVRFRNDGNVGIGTISPTSILQLGPGSFTATNASYKSFDAGAFGVLFRDAYDSYIMFNMSYTAAGWVNKYGTYKSALLSGTDGAFTFYTGTGTTAGGAAGETFRVVIANNGNVGISTTSPSSTLHVAGTVSYGTIRISPSSANGESAIAFFTDTAGTDTNDAWVIGHAPWGNTGDFAIGNENNGAGGNVRFLIEKSGNVGIGTTSPTDKLDIAAGSYYLKIGGRTTWDSSTSYPTIYSNGGQEWIFLHFPHVPYLENGFNGFTGTTAGAMIRFASNRTATNYFDAGCPSYGASNAFTIGGGGSSLVTVTSTGNVGIGTTNPAAKLHVGTANSDTGTQTVRISTAVGAANTVVDGLHLDFGGDNYNQGVAISMGTKSVTYGNYVSRIVSYLKTSTTTATKMQIQTQAGGGASWNTGIVLDADGRIGFNYSTPITIFDAYSEASSFATFGTQLSVGEWTGIHFGYRENNSLYRKSAIVFERTDLTSANAQGKVHILNGPQSGAGSATLSDAKLTIGESGNVGIGTTSPTSNLHVIGSVLSSGGFTGSLQGNAASSTYGVYLGDATDSRDRIDISLRVNSGFWQSDSPGAGWPAGASSWWHMLSTTHSNPGNYYAMQLAASFFSQGLWYRSTQGSGTTAWSQIVTNSGTWGISITGNAGTATTATTATNQSGGTVSATTGTFSGNITFSNGRKGLVGVYDAAQTQAIFAMGAAYVLTDGGSSSNIGPLYGLAWSYNPDYGGAGNNPQSKAGLNHQMLLMQNGITTTALGSGIWTSGNITAPTATFTPNTTGVSTGLNVVNGDITTYRSGGTSGVIYFGTSGARYLYYDGSNYYMPGGELYVDGTQVVKNSGTWSINITGNAGTITSQANSATITATSANTANQIVLRDGSGNFNASNIQATNIGVNVTPGSYTLDVNGSARFQSTEIRVQPGSGDCELGIGWGRTGNGYAIIDLRGDDTYTDYGLRIIRGNGGANTFSEITHRGSGDFILEAGEGGGSETATMKFNTQGAERMRITSDGEVWIASTSDQGAYNLQVGGTGVWGAGAYTNGSDARIKKNVQDLGSSLDTVKSLKPRTFQYQEWFSKDTTTQTGFIAQEMKQALEGQPYLNGLVKEDGLYMSVAYQNLIPVLVKAIQEQQAEIEYLKEKVESLLPSGSV